MRWTFTKYFRKNLINIANSTCPGLQMLAYPGYAFQLPDGSWQVSVSGVVWQAPAVFNRRQKMLIRMVGSVMQATPEELESPVFLERVTPFLSDCEARPKMKVAFGDKTFTFVKKNKTYRAI